MKRLRNLRADLVAARKIASKTGVSMWSKLCIACDVLYCRSCMNCTPEEYRMYEFHKYRNTYRRKFLFTSRSLAQYRKINPPRFAMHKKVFYKLIQRGIRREVLYLPEAGQAQFLAFVRKHRKVVTKPDVGSFGKGVQVFEYEDDEQALAFLNSLKEETVCEEYIRQHHALASLNPSSVNSVRIISLCADGEVTFIAASLKSGGRKNSIVDNMHNNGVGANVDLQTGVVTSVGYDYHYHTYIHHPVTGMQIIGFVVPFWQETLELVRSTHLDVAQCPLLGWDVAITETGPEVIEINSAPGPKLMQLMDQKPKGAYLRQYIKDHGGK